MNDKIILFYYRNQDNNGLHGLNFRVMTYHRFITNKIFIENFYKYVGNEINKMYYVDTKTLSLCTNKELLSWDVFCKIIKIPKEYKFKKIHIEYDTYIFNNVWYQESKLVDCQNYFKIKQKELLEITCIENDLKKYNIMKELTDENIIFDLKLIKIFKNKYDVYTSSNTQNLTTFIFPNKAKKYIHKQYNIDIPKSMKLVWKLNNYQKVTKSFWKIKLYTNIYNNIIICPYSLD